MFEGKKLKDLTEEDILRYAASLSSGGGCGGGAGDHSASEAQLAGGGSPEGDGGEGAAPGAEPGSRGGRAEEVGDADDDGEAALRRGVELEGRELARVRREKEEEEARRGQREADLVEERRRQKAEEEQLRVEALSQLDRSQMPAVRTNDGMLQKTIEHYTFADSEDVATVIIELDKDLFEGAASHLSEEGVEVVAKETEVTVILHRLPASKAVAALAEWRLHIAPLFHTIEPDRTTWRIRKGKLSVKLSKRKRQEWRRLVKF